MVASKSPFVLVPGAWSGAWNWKPIVGPLRGDGHEVYPVTLTGLGERSHLISPDINLQTHITDVVNIIEFNDLTDVVLVGHSYSGMVVTGVAGEIPGAIRHLVYVDSFLPEQGENFRDCLPPELAARNAERAEGHILPVPDGPGEAPDPEVAAWMQAKHRPHPVGTMTQPLPKGRPDSIPGTYVRCTESYTAAPLEKHVERARAAGFTIHDLPTIHHCMFTMPDELIGIFKEAAGQA
jgi:pimeloyl-ACP methyl ester carboxylesterase